MNTEETLLNGRILLRNARASNAEETIEIESVCFPPNEACPPDSMRARTALAPECFLVAYDREAGRIAGFLNGIATDESVFRDEFFTDAALHDPKGKNVMLLGLDVRPEYRGRGVARGIVEAYAARSRAAGREALYLTCHEALVPMYRRMGFRDLGPSASVWGGVTWNDMIRRLSCLTEPADEAENG